MFSIAEKIEKQTPEDYIELDRSQWQSIKPGSYVKYMGTDGKMRKGGRVITVDSSLIYFENEYSGQTANWSTDWSNIKNLYIRNPNIPTPTPIMSADGMPVSASASTIGTATDLVNAIAVLQAENQTIKEDIKKLIKAVSILNAKLALSKP